MPKINIRFDVVDGTIKQFAGLKTPQLRSGDQNYFYANFYLDSAWSDVTPKAVFARDATKIVMPLESNGICLECLIPSEVLQTAGEFWVGLIGGDRIVTNMFRVCVSDGCADSGATQPDPPTPDWFDNIEKQIEKKIDLPDGGTAGQVLTKTDDGQEWSPLPEGNVRADYAQNNPEADNYIENRTHWTEDSALEILPETQIELTGGETAGTGGAVLIAGQTYTVNYEGIKYTCKAAEVQLDATYICVGNYGEFFGEAGTGEPFCYGYIAPGVVEDYPDGAFLLCDFMPTSEGESKTVTISISIDNTTIRKLDNKYLDLDWLPAHKTKDLFKQTLTIWQKDTDDVNRMFNGYCNYALTAANEPLQTGKTYSVEWDGVEYTCVAKTLTWQVLEVVAIGNLNVFNSAEENNGLPFAIGTFQNNDDYGQFTVSIHENSRPDEETHTVVVATDIVEPLPEEFLPDSVARLDDIEVNAGIEIVHVIANLSSAGTITGTFKDTTLTQKAVYSKMYGSDKNTVVVLAIHTLNGMPPSAFLVPSHLAPGSAPTLTFSGDLYSGSGNVQKVTTKIGYVNTQNTLSVTVSDYVESVIMHSSTAGSSKKFKITVDDSGAISAKEVTG